MSRSLVVGLALLLALTLLAVAAPLLATDLAWLVRGPDGLRSPALGQWLGLSTRTANADDRVLIRAPIPHGPYRTALTEVLAPPSRHHWMGTDGLGRDLASRVLHGARVSLAVGLLAAAFSLLLGLPLGAIAGYRGGWADAIISRSVEGVLCFPTLLLVIAVLAIKPAWLHEVSDVLRIALVLGLTGWTVIVRYLRAEYVKLRGSDMVAAARASGGGGLRIAAFHILPCSLAPVLITASFAVGAAILMEGALSFLGLGVSPPTATWGRLLDEAQEEIYRAWWLALFPGLALFLAVFGCNLVGEGLRDLLDPRSTDRR